MMQNSSILGHMLITLSYFRPQTLKKKKRKKRKRKKLLAFLLQVLCWLGKWESRSYSASLPNWKERDPSSHAQTWRCFDVLVHMLEWAVRAISPYNLYVRNDAARGFPTVCQNGAIYEEEKSIWMGWYGCVSVKNLR